MRKLLTITFAVSLGMILVACGDGGKAAAEEGLSSAQAALDAVRPEGAQYAPELVQDIENSLRAARGTFENGNFRQALAEVQLLPKKMAALDAAVSAKKSDLTKEWSGLSATLPEIVDSIQGRAEVLSKSGGLPAGVSRATFNIGKTGADEVTKNWAEATEAMTKQNLAEAVAKARIVKARAAEVMPALGMQVPDALK